MKQIKVYIASPYSIGNKEDNVKKQINMASKLIDANFAPFVPLLYHYVEQAHPKNYDKWLAIDLEFLSSCDCVLRLRGESKGADIELMEARKLGMPVFYSLSDLMNAYKYINK